MDSSVSLPVDSDKGMVIPESAISFDYNPKAGEDEALIDAIVVHTKKIKPLASADLDSFLMLGRQFLNIGKPFTIEGLGTLDKAQTGELIFIPGQFITPKIEAPKALKENETEEKSGLFPDYDSEVKSNSSRTILIIFVLLILAAAGWAAYTFLYKPTQEQQLNAITEEQSILPDTTAPKDTLSRTVLSSDGYTFKIVFKETKDKADALKTMEKYKLMGHTVIMYTADSITYKVAEPFTLPLSDTAHVKDSLNRYYFLGKARVEL